MMSQFTEDSSRADAKAERAARRLRIEIAARLAAAIIMRAGSGGWTLSPKELAERALERADALIVAAKDETPRFPAHRSIPGG